MSELQFSKELRGEQTTIDGLVLYDLPVHGDNRGWFKENWQREKMIKAGLPDFRPVQNNISFNAEAGVTRGLHAEPWDKFVSVGAGSVFGAWCDLREGSKTFGKVFTTTLDASNAIYVPRGVANGFQALEDGTVYTYLVNDHWTPNPPEGSYAFVNIADPALAIEWPIRLDSVEISEKDRNHPMLEKALTIKPKKVMSTGAHGQLGRALSKLYPDADCVDRDSLDISDTEAVANARHWRDYGVILNAAAYTAVDTAETPEGRRDAWAANAVAVGNLARVACEYDITLVHISSDYVFDGTNNTHPETEQFTPLSVYGQSKAAGDIAATLAPRHYIARTSWVIGDGNNFVKTMQSLAQRDIKPSAVGDQVGRLTFTDTLAAGIKHLVDSNASYGTYNLTNDGDPVSWADIAKNVYEHSGKSPEDVAAVSTEEYYEGKTGIAPRPLGSVLPLDKIKATGFAPSDWRTELSAYLNNL